MASLKLGVAALALLAFSCCGGGKSTAPTPIPIPKLEPTWRSDRNDALNWMLGHRPKGSEWMWSPNNVHPLGLEWHGAQGSGEFFWVKLMDGSNYERFTYDGAFIYWREDHSEISQPQWPHGASAYTWSDVRWIPRRLPAPGSTISNADNRVTWFLPGCHAAVTNRYPIYTTYHGIEDDKLHVSFRVGGSPFEEHYWYDWEDGWIAWEGWRDGESRPRNASYFTDPRPGTPIAVAPCGGE